MRVLDFGLVTVLIIAAVSVAVGYGGTAMLDRTTGTTLEERCAARHAAIASLERIEDPTEQEREALAAYQAFVTTACGRV